MAGDPEMDPVAAVLPDLSALTGAEHFPAAGPSCTNTRSWPTFSALTIRGLDPDSAIGRPVGRPRPSRRRRAAARRGGDAKDASPPGPRPLMDGLTHSSNALEPARSRARCSTIKPHRKERSGSPTGRCQLNQLLVAVSPVRVKRQVLEPPSIVLSSDCCLVVAGDRPGVGAVTLMEEVRGDGVKPKLYERCTHVIEYETPEQVLSGLESPEGPAPARNEIVPENLTRLTTIELGVIESDGGSEKLGDAGPITSIGSHEHPGHHILRCRARQEVAHFYARHGVSHHLSSIS
jgi:hypothetical protein